jgi:YegS/Rv2252/BmrU family lipid kinase
MRKIDSDALFIVNPRAGNGAAGRKLEHIKLLARKFFPDFQVLVTDGPGRATEYAQQALRAGVHQVICVGGDGTLNEVVNGLMALKVEKSKRPQLGYLPLGTASDLAKSVGIETNIENGLRDISSMKGRWVDVGLATFIGHDRKITSRYFVNVLSLALGGEVVGRVNRSSKSFGGFLTFLWATLATMVTFKKPLIRLQIDGRVDRQFLCWHIAVANGQYQGGGMRIAPDAKVDDGRLRVTVVGDLSWLEVLLNLPRLYNGGIYEVDQVSRYTGRKIEASSKEAVLIDLDGEPVGLLPLKVEIQPLALWMIY